MRNATGEYNCFLNVIIQCLWPCTRFRHALMQWPPQAYQVSKVATALIGLFHAIAQQAGGQAQEVDPTPLREALSQLGGKEFGVGNMSDAAELMMAMYQHLEPVAARAGQPQLLQDMFCICIQLPHTTNPLSPTAAACLWSSATIY